MRARGGEEGRNSEGNSGCENRKCEGKVLLPCGLLGSEGGTPQGRFGNLPMQTREQSGSGAFGCADESEAESLLSISGSRLLRGAQQHELMSQASPQQQ